MARTKTRRAKSPGAASTTVITSTEAARGFGRLVDRVREQQAVYVVERGGVPVARIGPAVERRCTVRDLVALLRSRPSLDEAYLREVDAVTKAANRPVVPRSPWERSSTRAS